MPRSYVVRLAQAAELGGAARIVAVERRRSTTQNASGMVWCLQAESALPRDIDIPVCQMGMGSLSSTLSGQWPCAGGVAFAARGGSGGRAPPLCGHTLLLADDDAWRGR